MSAAHVEYRWPPDEFRADSHDPLWEGNLRIPDGCWLTPGPRIATEAAYAPRLVRLLALPWAFVGDAGERHSIVRSAGGPIRVDSPCWIVRDATTSGLTRGCVALTFDEEPARLLARLLNRHGLVGPDDSPANAYGEVAW